MAFQVMDADCRQFPAVRQRARQRRAAQQRADQAGACGVGDAVQLPGRGGGRAERISHQRQQALHVIARCQFRHHAAIHPMQVDLAPQAVGEQPALLVQHRHGAFIAGRFDCQDSHGAPLDPV
jgi:hypothetical protein